MDERKSHAASARSLVRRPLVLCVVARNCAALCFDSVGQDKTPSGRYPDETTKFSSFHFMI
jgi:hypothetical protein